MKDITKQFREKQFRMTHKHKRMLKLVTRKMQKVPKYPIHGQKLQRNNSIIPEGSLEGKKGVIYY